MKILLSLLTVASLNAYDAKIISTDDGKRLKEIDAKLYQLATTKQKYNFKKITDFIIKNLAYKRDYSMLKVDAKASARMIQNDKTRDATALQEEESRLKAEVLLTYPLFDPREKYERKKKIIETKQKLIGDTKKYFDSKIKLDDLEIQKLILLELEIRDKARKLTASGGFNDWLKTIENIRKVNKDIADAKVEMSESRLVLLSYVKDAAKSQLKKML